MRKIQLLITCCLLGIGSMSAGIRRVNIPQKKEINIVQLGASVSSPDNARFIQQALDEVSLSGGGKVIVPTGVFLSGPILLKSNTELFLSEGAVLRMLPYGEGDGVKAGTFPNNGTTGVYPSFITAKEVENVKVSGTGCVDGQGSDWWTAYRKVKGTSTVMKRGCLIIFLDTRVAEISGIRLINAPNVHITVGRRSSDVAIDGITIQTPEDAPNSDGIDTWAPNIEIKNCRICCGDDNIAMDSGTQNIVVKNCYFGSGHGCSIGSFTHNISHVLVDSCTFKGTTSAIRMKSNRNRGGGESAIVYSNISIDNVKNPIFIASYYPKVPKKIEEETALALTENTPSWSNIILRNITIGHCETAAEVWGLPEKPINNILFENVRIHSKKGILLYYADGVQFRNSTIRISEGDVLKTFQSNYTGLDATTGNPTN